MLNFSKRLSDPTYARSNSKAAYAYANYGSYLRTTDENCQAKCNGNCVSVYMPFGRGRGPETRGLPYMRAKPTAAAALPECTSSVRRAVAPACFRVLDIEALIDEPVRRGPAKDPCHEHDSFLNHPLPCVLIDHVGIGRRRGVPHNVRSVGQPSLMLRKATCLSTNISATAC
jgi:hypothetical protein